MLIGFNLEKRKNDILKPFSSGVIMSTVDSEKIVRSKFCEFTENRFLRFFNFANWPQHGVPAIHLK